MLSEPQRWVIWLRLEAPNEYHMPCGCQRERGLLFFRSHAVASEPHPYACQFARLENKLRLGLSEVFVSLLFVFAEKSHLD